MYLLLFFRELILFHNVWAFPALFPAQVKPLAKVESLLKDNLCPLAKDKRNGNGLFLIPAPWLVLCYKPILIHASTFLCSFLRSFLQGRLKSMKCTRSNAVESKQQCRYGWHPEKLQESHSDHLPTVCVEAAAAQKFKAARSVQLPLHHCCPELPALGHSRLGFTQQGFKQPPEFLLALNSS